MAPASDPSSTRRMLSVYGLDLDLTDAQWARLSREEMASVFDAGVRFESTLMANFGLSPAYRDDLTDPRVTYMLHEIGEETRHSRLFVRVISQLKPTAKNPFNGWIFRIADRVVGSWALRHDAAFMVMILFGEEGPDLLQKLAVDDPETDPFIKEVNLPTWKTWNAARKTPERMAMKRQVLRPVCDALIAAGAFRGDRPTRAWRRALAE